MKITAEKKQVPIVFRDVLHGQPFKYNEAFYVRMDSEHRRYAIGLSGLNVMGGEMILFEHDTPIDEVYTEMVLR